MRFLTLSSLSPVRAALLLAAVFSWTVLGGVTSSSAQPLDTRADQPTSSVRAETESAAARSAASGVDRFDEARAYYVVDEEPIVFEDADSTATVDRLAFRDEIRVLGTRGSWYHVRTPEGTEGFVRSTAVSNVWVRVSKANRMVYVYRGSNLIHRFRADLGYNTRDDKVRRGSEEEPDQWRTPEGRFLITDKNENSQFYRALVLNYPTAEDAERGLEHGLISRSEYAAIVKADQQHETPPMNTTLGGWIEIHGEGTGGKIDWTQGCIALQNQHLDRVWKLVYEGTPVLVQ